MRSFRRRSTSSLSGEEKVNMLQVRRGGDLVTAKAKLWGKEHQLSLRGGEGHHALGEERRWLSYDQGLGEALGDGALALSQGRREVNMLKVRREGD
jgi:hypothetical protein